MQSMRWAWGYIRHYRVRLFISLSLSLVISALNMVNPYFAGKIVDKVIFGHQSRLLLPFLAIMIGVTIVKTVIRYNYQLSFERISQGVIFKLREKCMIGFTNWILVFMIEPKQETSWLE